MRNFLSNRRAPESTPESTEQRQVLRARLSEEMPAGIRWEKVFSDMHTAVMFEFVRMFPPAPNTSMCTYYGHIVNQNSWKSQFPSCRDCGKEITSPNQLRKAEVMAS